MLDRDAQHRSACAAVAEGRFDAALSCYEAVLRELPGDVETLLRIGALHVLAGRTAQAYRVFAEVARGVPAHRLAVGGLTLAAVRNRRAGDALPFLAAALQADPDYVDGWALLSDVRRRLGDLAGAAAAAARALDADPTQVEALLTRGRIALAAGRFAGAEADFRSAAEHAPQHPEAAMSLASLAHALGRFDEAVMHARRAVELAPHDPQAHLNLGMARFAGGDCGGLEELDWGFRGGQWDGLRAQGRLWRGQDLGAGELLLVRDQGIGDFILFSRLFPLARARGGRLNVECPPELAPLYGNFAGIDELLAAPVRPARRDRAAAVMGVCGLPMLLGFDPPGALQTPYVHADPELTARYRARFAALGGRRAIGIAWAGDRSFGFDALRSCGLAPFARLADIEGAAWVSLQKDTGEAESAAPLRPLPLRLTDFGETAAAIAALDLVLSVDTAVAHLAGALGAPVWVLHGSSNAWLWGTHASAPPWYPTMRGFRQPRPGDWVGLFAEVERELAAWMRRRSSR